MQVKQPLRIFRHIKPLHQLYRDMLRFVPYPKPTHSSVSNSSNQDSGVHDRSEPRTPSKFLENSCPNLKAVFKQLKNSKTTGKESVLKSPHRLNSPLNPGRRGYLTAPDPILSPLLTKSYVRSDQGVPSVLDLTLDMSSA